MKKFFYIFGFLILILIALSKCSEAAKERREFTRYDILQDPTLLAIEKEFRDDPAKSMVCNKPNNCVSSLVEKRDRYLKENCLILRGTWSYTDDTNNFSLRISRNYYKKNSCSS